MCDKNCPHINCLTDKLLIKRGSCKKAIPLSSAADGESVKCNDLFWVCSEVETSCGTIDALRLREIQAQTGTLLPTDTVITCHDGVLGKTPIASLGIGFDCENATDLTCDTKFIDCEGKSRVLASINFNPEISLLACDNNIIGTFPAASLPGMVFDCNTVTDLTCDTKFIDCAGQSRVLSTIVPDANLQLLGCSNNILGTFQVGSLASVLFSCDNLDLLVSDQLVDCHGDTHTIKQTATIPCDDNLELIYSSDVVNAPIRRGKIPTTQVVPCASEFFFCDPTDSAIKKSSIPSGEFQFDADGELVICQNGALVKIPIQSFVDFVCQSCNQPIIFDENYIVSFLVYDFGYSTDAPNAEWYVNSVFAKQNDPAGLLPAEIPYWLAGYQQPNFPDLTNPGDVVLYWKQIQAQGKKMHLSLGGANFQFNDAIGDDPTAQNVADSFASFFWGISTPNPLLWNGPLTTNISSGSIPFQFDGIDLDFEGLGNTSVARTFISQLRAWADTTTPKKIITCAPQAPYIWSGNDSVYTSGDFPYAAFNTPLLSYSPGSTSLFAANFIGNFDYINVQFYNQFAANVYPGQVNFAFTLAQWGWMCLQSTTPNRPTPKIYIGVGYDSQPTPNYNINNPSPAPSAATIAAAIDAGITSAQALIDAANGSPVPVADWLAGLMVWQSPQGNQYLKDIYSFSSKLPQSFMLYGGQNGFTPYGEKTNPVWPI